MNISDAEFCSALRSMDWSEVYKLHDVDMAYSLFEDNVRSVLDVVAPLVKSQPRKSNKSWITRSTRAQFSERDRLRNTAVDTKNYEDWKLYRKQRNVCTLLAKQDKINYFTDKYKKCESEGDIGTLYNVTKKQLGWITGGTPKTFLQAGKLTSSPKELAEIQNNYFF